ncbi:MAG: hypothetical protein EBR82_51890 [Caulobacteraceae bacterium]|nr:hypothetical protein [Caulobacteraceae bacterium]
MVGVVQHLVMAVALVALVGSERERKAYLLGMTIRLLLEEEVAAGLAEPQAQIHLFPGPAFQMTPLFLTLLEPPLQYLERH